MYLLIFQVVSYVWEYTQQYFDNHGFNVRFKRPHEGFARKMTIGQSVMIRAKLMNTKKYRNLISIQAEHSA